MEDVIERQDNGMVIHKFSKGAAPEIYTDAIVMKASIYDALTPEEIEAIKQSRYDYWLSIMYPPEAPAETPALV